MKEQAISSDNASEIQIIHFNDVYDVEPNNFGDYGFLNFYSKYQEILKIYPQSLTVFSGDAFAPSKLSKVFKGLQMVTCLKMLKIDVACYGNHEFDYPLEHATELAKMCGFPWLLANVKNKQTNKLLGDAQQFVIAERGGLKIGFFGLAGPDFKGRLISFYKQIAVYEDHIQCAKRICGVLKKNNCDLIIAVTHMRVPPDQGLAKKVPYIDMILGGHDHFQLCKIVEKTPILKSGKNFQKLGVYRIRKDKPEKVQKGESLFQGKKWWFITQCLSVGKTKAPNPELEVYINSLVQKWKQRGLAENSKKMEIKIVLPNGKPQWKFSEDLINGKIVNFIQSNNSSEICFAKFVAFQKKMHFGGILPGKCLLEGNLNFVEQTLNTICKMVGRCKQGVSKSAIFSEGFHFIPYFVECSNLVFLPSSLDFIFSSIKQIESALRKAQESGIRCNAIIQKSKFLHTEKSRKFGCRIKFVNIPEKYKQTLQNAGINSLFEFEEIFEVVEIQKIQAYQGGNYKNRILIELEGKGEAKYCLDYYHLLQCCQNWKINKSENIGTAELSIPAHLFDLLKAIPDFSPSKADLEKAVYLVEKSRSNEKFYICQQRSEAQFGKQRCEVFTFGLYHARQSDIQFMNSFFSTQLGRQYIRVRNQVDLVDEGNNAPSGLVFNDYLISNPTYQLGYGYLPILFGEGRILKSLHELLTQEQARLKKWVNINEQGSRDIIEPISLKNEQKGCPKLLIIKNRPKSFRTVEWVTKYAKALQWENKFIDSSFILLTITKFARLFSK